jgi:CHAD domain-containing protein
MAAVIPLPARAAESRGLLYWMERVLKERDRVVASADEESIHDLRVALRRCRSLASVFEEVDPNPAWRELRKTSRKLFRSLGVIRDSQVQEVWVLNLAAPDDPLRAQILYAVKNGRERQERDAKKSAARFDEKYWVKLARELRSRLRLLPLDGDAAQCLALERYEEAAELHRRALRTEKPKPWHELRIGVKHLRYAVENLLPKLHSAWGSDLKRVQDLLGDVHDLDVLAETVRGAASDLSGSAKWQLLIAKERSDRLETYRQIALGTTGLWSQWRAGLPTNGRVAVVAASRLKATARAADPKFAKSAAVGRLAHKIFRELRHAKVAAILSDEKLESLMNAAATLHAIEPTESAKAAHKDARNFLSELPAPPGWTAADWHLLALIVRYHRGPAPSAENARFAELEPQQQAKLLLAAGTLRIARALRKMGVEPGAKLRAERKTDHLELLVAGFSEAQTAPKSLTVGRQMLEAAIGTAIVIRSLELAEPALPLQFPAAKPQPIAENDVKLLTGD